MITHKTFQPSETYTLIGREPFRPVKVIGREQHTFPNMVFAEPSIKVQHANGSIEVVPERYVQTYTWQQHLTWKAERELAELASVKQAAAKNTELCAVAVEFLDAFGIDIAGSVRDCAPEFHTEAYDHNEAEFAFTADEMRELIAKLKEKS